jgi:hypothetical protein
MRPEKDLELESGAISIAKLRAIRCSCAKLLNGDAFMRSMIAFLLYLLRIGRQTPFGSLAALTLGLLISCPVHAESSNARTQFLEQYQPNAKALQDYYSNVVYKLVHTTVGPENTLVDEAEGKCALGCYLCTVGGKAIKNNTGETYAHTMQRTEGGNSSYSFTVLRKENGGYAAKDVTLLKKGDQSLFFTASVPFANAFRQMTYLDIARDTDTIFLALEDRVWQNEPVKVLRTEYTDLFKNRTTAEYYFSPTNGWLCRGERVATTGGSQYVEETYFYESRESEPFPALKRIEQWVHDDKNPAKTRRTNFTEFSEFRHVVPFPESDFRLTAFGLPEPATPKSPSWWPLWASYLLGAIGLAIAAVLFAWLARRFRKKVEPTGNG